MMAMVQVRRLSAGQAYHRRKLTEGRSPKEALRCPNAGSGMRSIGACWPISTTLVDACTVTCRSGEPGRRLWGGRWGGRGAADGAHRQQAEEVVGMEAITSTRPVVVEKTPWSASTIHMTQSAVALASW
jgi:hypothetical protein